MLGITCKKYVSYLGIHSVSSLISVLFKVLLTVSGNSSHCSWACNLWGENSNSFRSIWLSGPRSTWCLALCASPQFPHRSFFFEPGLTMLSDSVAIADSLTSSSVCAPWSHVETVSVGQVLKDLRACWDQVSQRGRTAKDTCE